MRESYNFLFECILINQPTVCLMTHVSSRVASTFSFFEQFPTFTFPGYVWMWMQNWIREEIVSSAMTARHYKKKEVLLKQLLDYRNFFFILHPMHPGCQMSLFPLGQKSAWQWLLENPIVIVVWMQSTKTASVASRTYRLEGGNRWNTGCAASKPTRLQLRWN